MEIEFRGDEVWIVCVEFGEAFDVFAEVLRDNALKTFALFHFFSNFKRIFPRKAKLQPS